MTSTLSDAAKAVATILETHINANSLDVPMLPKVAGKVVTLSQDPESDAAQLAQLVQSDQSLAAHVMRIANSAAYSPNASIVSLQQAIARLGMGLISDIALAASINTKMFSTPGYENHVDYVWKHALASALWSKEVARTCRRSVEAAFLCGLLHSIGRPVVLQAVLEIAKQQDIILTSEDALALEETYQKTVGISVIERWEMPKIVCESTRFFDDYSNASLVGEPAAMVNGGAQFATHMLKPDELDADTLVSLPVLADLNLYQDEVDLLLEKRDVVNSTMETMSA